MKKLILSGVAACVLAAATPTIAADMPVKAAPVAAPLSVYNWSGLYLGLHVGGGWANVDYGPGSATPPGTPGNPFNASGLVAGGILGYNLQAGALVYGLEADASYSSITGNRGFVSDFDIPWILTFRARAGYAWDRMLLFVTAGLGVARGDSNEPASGGTFGTTHTGFVAGFGLEWAAGGNMRLRGEYQYGTYGSKDYFFPLAVPHTHAVRFDTHIVRAAALWRF